MIAFYLGTMVLIVLLFGGAYLIFKKTQEMIDKNNKDLALSDKERHKD